jgi:hypothetical protein
MKCQYLLALSLLVLVGLPSAFPQAAAPTVKTSMPTIPNRPKFFFLETTAFNLLVHHGEGELATDGSLIINGYKNDPSTTVPIDFWIFGTVLQRQGELQSVVLTKFAEQGEELVLIIFLKHRGMNNAIVALYRPESHGLQVIKELQDLGADSPVAIVRMRCARDPNIMDYFLIPKESAKPDAEKPLIPKESAKPDAEKPLKGSIPVAANKRAK